MIPSLSAHMQKEFSKKEEIFEFETRMKPLFSTDQSVKLIDIVLSENNLKKSELIDSELFVYRKSDPIL